MPLFERIDSIFVPVTDVNASAAWYKNRLQLKPLPSEESGLASFQVCEGKTKLTLVKTKHFQPIRYIDEKHKAPYYNLHTLHFERTCAQLREAGVPVSDMMENEYIYYCELTDPDGNWLGVCYEKEGSPFYKTEQEEPRLFDRVGAVFIPVRDLQRSLDWYEKGLGLTLYHHWGAGADLGVGGKDNLITLLQTDKDGASSLGDAGRSYFSFFASDLEATRSVLDRNGIPSTTSAEEGAFAYSRLTDPDGHGLLVVSGVKERAAAIV